MEENLRKKEEEIQLKLIAINNETEKRKKEQEIINREKLLKEEIELKKKSQTKKEENELKELNEKKGREQEFQNMQFIDKSEKMKNNLITILKKISKLEIINKELKRKINLKPTIQKNLSEKNFIEDTNTSIIIRVENYEEGEVYYWTAETFINRYDSMKALFNKFNDDELEIENFKKEDDPLWQESKPYLLGYAFYRLEPIAYLMSNKSDLVILSPSGDIIGQLVIDIIPHDEEGNEYDEVPEFPTDLIGQKLFFKIKIYEIKNFKKNMCANLHIEYQYFYDHSIVKSKIYNQKEIYNNFCNDKCDIDINEEFEHKIDFLTKEDINFLENEQICFKIYGKEQIEKKGKTPIEDILKNIKEEEYNNIENNKNNNDINIKNNDEMLNNWKVVYHDNIKNINEEMKNDKYNLPTNHG